MGLGARGIQGLLDTLPARDMFRSPNFPTCGIGTPEWGTRAMWTFFLLKPDSVHRHLLGDIRERIVGRGFGIRDEFALKLDDRSILDLYERFVFSILPEDQRSIVIEYTNIYLTGGLCGYMEVVPSPECGPAEDVFRFARSIRGEKFLPERCAPGSIRYDFRDQSSPVERRIVGVTPIGVPLVHGVVHNLVHSPESPEERDHQSAILKRLRSGDLS